MSQKYIYILFSLVTFGFHSCNSKAKEGASNSNDTSSDMEQIDTSLLRKGVVQKLDFAILNLRKSDHFIEILSKQPNLYEEAVLNNVKMVVNYESSKAKALNLGVYGADLNFVIHFNQIPISFKYLLCSKQLADQIGASMAFNKEAVDKYNNNVDQKDSLINIVNSAYDIIKKYLKSGEQFQLASLVMTGSWVENLNLTLLKLDNCDNGDEKQTILSEIALQEEYLNNLISLLTILNIVNNPVISKLTNSLSSIESVYIKQHSSKAVFDTNELKQAIVSLRKEIIEMH